MIQGGIDGMFKWLKLDSKYLEEHCSEICDYAYHRKRDIKDPYELLWILLEYSNYSKKPLNHPVIDPKAINDLAVDAQMGCEESKELLVLYLYKLAYKTAGRFAWAMDRFLFERMDLTHEGLLGIETALEKWSINEDKDFAYWAQMHMYSAIQRLVTEGGPIIKLPYHRQILKSKLPRIREELEELFGRPVTWEEMAWYIRSEGYDVGIGKMLEAPELALLEATCVVPLDPIVTEDEHGSLEVIDTIPDDGSDLLRGKQDPFREIEYKEIVDMLIDIALDDVEQFVVENYREGSLGSLTGAEVAIALAEEEMTSVIYTEATITNIFQRACIKMKSAAEDLDMDRDMVFS